MAESTTTAKHDVTVDFGCIELTGSLVHDDEHRVLELENAEGPAEPISISLQGYGLTPEPGNVLIKDWSEHLGLTAQEGLVKPVHTLTVGRTARRPTSAGDAVKAADGHIHPADGATA